MSFPLFFRALHLMLASSSGVSKCFLGFQGSRKDFAQQKLCGIISGLPQKSHGEFCGKRSGRRIRSCGKRSAPQTKPPCRDEVGSLPPANLGTAYFPCRFRAPAQMRSRCVGRGDASRAVKPRGTQRRTCWLCGDESAVSPARDGVRRGTSLTEGLLIPCTSRKESSLPRKARNPRPPFRLSAPQKAQTHGRPPIPLPPSPGSPKKDVVFFWGEVEGGAPKGRKESPLSPNLLLRKIFAGTLYKRDVPRARGSGRAAECVTLL